MTKLRMLCFPGRNTNAEIFRMQLAPYMTALEAAGVLDLYFTEGTIEDRDETGWDIYGPPPNLRFYEENLIPSSRYTPVRKHSVNSVVKSYDTDKGGDFPAQESVRKALADVHCLIEAKGPFDGVIGFSEGGSLAAMVLTEDQENARRGLPNNSLKCGIFFNSYPPFTSNGKLLMLSSEFGEPIQVPTFHIVSGSDNFHTASVALRQLCSQEQCSVFEHSEGHVVPWKPGVVRPLKVKIRQFLDDVRNGL